MEKSTIESILEVLHAEIKPAIGCTEPAAVALACCKARETLGGVPRRALVRVSGNIYKNAMGVGIPGTGLTGLPIAIALGLTSGESCKKLEILSGVDQPRVAAARELLKSGAIEIAVAPDVDKLYIEVQVENESGTATAVIERRHDHFARVTKNGETLHEKQPDKNEERTEKETAKNDFQLSLKLIAEFADAVDVADLTFFDKSIELNTAIAREGLAEGYGFRMGQQVVGTKSIDNLPADQYAAALACAASDARMGGSTLTVMSNTGSGNQGLTATLPVVAYAERLGKDREATLRALAVSHLVPIHMKRRVGPLSALCGVLLASCGVTCAIVRLRGGGLEPMERAVRVVASNLTGMLCDGAKPGCSLKIHSGVTAAAQAAEIALDSRIPVPCDGVVDPDIEQTIQNIALIGSQGLASTDQLMVKMMQERKIQA